jgi:outer membrane protein
VPQARAGLLPNLSAGAECPARAPRSTAVDHRQPQCSFIPGHAGAAVVPRRSLVPVPGRQGRQRAGRAATLGHRAEPDPANRQQLLQRAARQDNLASTKAEEAAFKRQLDQSNERFDVGLSDKTDVLQSQASYDTARANRIVARARWMMPSKR